MPTTISTPTQTPAWKISPISSQELNKKHDATKSSKKARNDDAIKSFSI